MAGPGLRPRAIGPEADPALESRRDANEVVSVHRVGRLGAVAMASPFKRQPTPPTGSLSA